MNFDSPEFTNVLSITDIENHEEFFDELYDLCKKNNIPMDGVSSENAPNQFEVNLKHIDNPLKAADQAIIFKRFIKTSPFKPKLYLCFNNLFLVELYFRLTFCLQLDKHFIILVHKEMYFIESNSEY